MQDVNKKRFWLHKIQLPVTIFVHNVGDPVLDTEVKNVKIAIGELFGFNAKFRGLLAQSLVYLLPSDCLLSPSSFTNFSR